MSGLHRRDQEFVNYQWMLKFVRNIKPHNDKNRFASLGYKHLTAGGYRAQQSQIRIHQDFRLQGWRGEAIFIKWGTPREVAGKSFSEMVALGSHT